MKTAWLKDQEGRCRSQAEGCKWKLPISAPDLCGRMRQEVALTSLPTQQGLSILIDCGMWGKQQTAGRFPGNGSREGCGRGGGTGDGSV